MSGATVRTLYLSGPMTGLPEMNFPAFHAAAAKLRALGLEVWSPAEGVPHHDLWEGYMRHDLRVLLQCGAIALLPGWRNSRGARLEHRVARELGFLVLEVV